ncbi:MAG: hypothetical protein SPI72_00415 [Porphyromonas sp.]|nr:hypothetical protein [Porphyromonas sp.]
MKTIRILSVLVALLLVPMIVGAQEEIGEKPTDETYQIMEFPLHDGTVWVNMCGMYVYDDTNVYSEENTPRGLFFSYVFIHGDTTINGLNYKKAYCTKDVGFPANETSYWGALRQEKGVVYLRLPQGLTDPETYPDTFLEMGGWHWAGNVSPFNFWEEFDEIHSGTTLDPNREYILYDFNLYNDPKMAYERVWGREGNKHIRFEGYDYEYVAGKWRRTVSFAGNKWVDGIGSMNGFGFTDVLVAFLSGPMLKNKAPGQYLFDSYSSYGLLCFLQDDQVIYHNSGLRDLDYKPILPKEEVVAQDCFRVDQMINIEDLGINDPFRPEEWTFAIDGNRLRWGKADLKTLTLYTMGAERVWSDDVEGKASVDLPFLLTGLYLYIATDVQGLRYTGKLHLGE